MLLADTIMSYENMRMTKNSFLSQYSDEIMRLVDI